MKLNKILPIGMSLCLFTLSSPCPKSLAGEKIQQGEVVTFITDATPSFYIATSNDIICTVSARIGSFEVFVDVKAENPGVCKIMYFNNNALIGTREYEVTSGITPGDYLVPCYEFYSESANDHYYTINEALKELLQTEYAHWGYKYQGIAFYVYDREEK